MFPGQPFRKLWLVWLCFRTGKYLVTIFFHNGKIDTFWVLGGCLAPRWARRKREESAVLQSEPHNTGKPLCRSQNLDIAHLAIFPPNGIFPVSFPTVSVKGLWQPMGHGCSTPSVVPPPTSTGELEGAARIGGVEGVSVSSFSLLYVSHLPVGDALRMHQPQVLSQGWVLAGCYNPAWTRLGPQLIPSGIPVMHVS